MMPEPTLDTECGACGHSFGRHWTTNDKRPGAARQGCVESEPDVAAESGGGPCRCEAFMVKWVPALAAPVPQLHDHTAPRHLTYGDPPPFVSGGVDVAYGQPGGGQIEQQPGLQADVTWEPIS